MSFGKTWDTDYTVKEIERRAKALKDGKWISDRQQIRRPDRNYRREQVKRQIEDRQRANWLPGGQILRPGEYSLKTLTLISKTWLESKRRNESDGRRLQTILMRHSRSKPNFIAFGRDGTVLASPPADSTAIDLYRSIKYLDTWIEHYGIYHWPPQFVRYVCDLYYHDDYNHVAIFQILGEEKTKLHITDPNAIAACIWMAISRSFQSAKDEDIASDARRFFHITWKDQPFAGWYADQC